MSVSQKFLTFRFKDIRKYLTDEQKAQLAAISNTIVNGRSADKVPADHLFTLNGVEKYAGYALDAYIDAVQRDLLPEPDPNQPQFKIASAAMHEQNETITEAMREAMRVRDSGQMATDPRLPSKS